MGKPKEIKYQYRYMKGTDIRVRRTMLMEHRKGTKFIWVRKDNGAHVEKHQTEYK